MSAPLSPPPPSATKPAGGSAPTAFHVEAPEVLLERLRSTPLGLSAQEAAARLLTTGANELPTPPPPSALKQFFGQFANPIVGTLLVAGVVAVVNGAGNAQEGFLARWGDAISIVLIVVLNAVLGYVQERRAGAALDALQKMLSPSARVLRDEQPMVIPAREVVPGDILEVEPGDAIAADARILQAIDLSVDEASLTGESVPATKDALAELASDAPLGDQATMLFVGTLVVRGKGRALVVATGPNTQLGKVSTLMGAPRESTTPLEERLEHFGKRILWACLILSALIFGWGLYLGKETWQQILLGAVSLAVAAIPEGLPAITTITLALGMQRMAKRGAIVRKLAAVETLGSATVICTDKTGTLTQNEMTVREVFCGGRSYDVTGTGYEPVGEVMNVDGSHADTDYAPLRHLLASAALANSARLEAGEGGRYRVVGDPTEGALLTLSAKGGQAKESVLPSHRILKELPFDSDRKRMTVLTLDAKGREIVHTKGSTDVLLPLCHAHETAEGIVELTDEQRAGIQAEADRMSGEALRVLAVARRELTRHVHDDGSHDHGDLEQRLCFLGLVAMIDPPRVGVKEAVRACADAGVRAVMITGDHKLTAVAIARELGLWEEGAIALTGTELAALSDEALAARIDATRVFARVTAEQKLRIVRAFKARGHVVAMTGDGVNDAPALREAHIGVAMGKDGTDVARDAADMVLADDNFATIVEAVREGRAIWRNIQKFIFFLLSSNAGLVVTVFVAAFVPGLPPLRPIMILWINLVTNGLPALALGVDPPDDSQMLEPPREVSAGLLGKREYFGIAFVGVVMGGLGVACYVYPWQLEPGVAEPERVLYGRALAFSLLALSPLFHAFSCRSATRSIFKLRPGFSAPLLLAVALSAAIHLVAVLVPSLRVVFQTYSLTGAHWLVLVGLSILIVPVIEGTKALQRVAVVGKSLGPMSRRA
ncbi:MAG TPA: cation-translocating P-type ATPase [Polyangiaceae bacterium]|nr:cation-translocating P-type ATPase [Polyangiaceae bacterium]